MDFLDKDFLNSIYAQCLRKHMKLLEIFILYERMLDEFDEKVNEFWDSPKGFFAVKKPDESIDSNKHDKRSNMPSQLRAFVLSINKRIMRDFYDGK